MISQQLLNYIKQQIQIGTNGEDIKNVLIRKGWNASDVIKALNTINNNTTTFPQASSNNKKFFTKKLLVLLILIVIFLAGAGAFTIKFLNIFKGKSQQSVSSGTLFTTPTPPPFIQGEITRSLERNPTKKVLTQEVYVSLSGDTQTQDGRYVGSIKEGIGFNPKSEDREKQEKILQQIKNDLKASISLFIIEARDINDQILLQIPIAVAHGTIGGDVPNYSYQDPGFFSVYILLPINTNSLVLRERSGNILDRIYTEEWQPEVKIVSYPRSVGSTDKFQVEVELQPPGKAYSYSLFLKNAKGGSSMGRIGGSLQPKSGKITENINLNQYPFTTTDSWVIEAVGYSLFHSRSTTSEPISINLSSENIEVKISGKDKTTRRSGESDYISWSHIFYGIDVTRGLKELCEKGRCFELIWSGEGVQFNEKYWESKPVNTVTTQITSLKCTFRGSGKQSIHLQIKENGKIIGEDTYTYTVSGIGTEQSICQINDY